MFRKFIYFIFACCLFFSCNKQVKEKGLEYVESVDWSLIWGIVKDTIIPHSGTLIFHIILFLIIGILLSIIYSIVLYRKKILKRKLKYYNWLVKLYIPMLIGIFLYVFGQLGALKGIYNILIKEKEPIVTSVYNNSLSLAFESEESKDNFIKNIQLAAKEAKSDSNLLIAQLNEASKNYNTGFSLIDNGKNKISNYLIKKYGDDIYKIGVYGMLNLAGARAHANINESLPYNEFSAAMDFLLDVGYKDIELSIKDKLTIWFISLLESQYYSMMKSLYILLLILMSIPFIEFFVYKKWIEPNLKP